MEEKKESAIYAIIYDPVSTSSYTMRSLLLFSPLTLL